MLVDSKMDDNSLDFSYFGMGYSLTQSEEEALSFPDICEISRWEDEGGATQYG